MKCRDYQEHAVNSIFDYFETGTGNPIVGMPTGTGKSVVIAEFLRRVYMQWPGQRVIKLTHVKELIEQNYDKLLKMWPNAPAGIYSAGLKRRDLNSPITFAGIASAVNVADSFGHVDLILIDECHLVSPEQNTMYGVFIGKLMKANPALKVVGFTATHYRMKQGSLIEDGGIFTDVCVDMTGRDEFNWFIDSGYLSMLVPRPTHTQLHTDNARISGGDFNLKDLQNEVNVDASNHAAIEETIHYGQDRSRWLLFATGIEHTINLTKVLQANGIEATCVHSKLKPAERAARLAAHKRGDVQAMVNNGILTTGYDDPEIDLIGAMRQTRSPGLWVQMLGRGTRPCYAPGYDLETHSGRLDAMRDGPAPDCMVLDFVCNTEYLGPINDPVLPKRRGKSKSGGTAPVRVCEGCGAYVHASLRECPHCHFVFPAGQGPRVNAVASTAALIARTEEPQVDDFTVNRVVYNRHNKKDMPPSLRATYYCGLRRFDKWLCPEHGHKAAYKFRTWWHEHSALPSTAPATVEEAVQRMAELKTPTGVRVWHNKKNPEIMSYAY